jgi:hypothetical protein
MRFLDGGGRCEGINGVERDGVRMRSLCAITLYTLKHIPSLVIVMTLLAQRPGFSRRERAAQDHFKKPTILRAKRSAGTRCLTTVQKICAKT